MSLKREVSIIICFYNAENKLSKTLEYIKLLDVLSVDKIELILVNNNSTDRSCQVIDEQLKSFTSFPWKIVTETTPGLSSARNRGINESKYNTLLFCDDDNWLSPNYLNIGIDTLNSDETIGILGGKGIAVSDIQLPEWFEAHQNYYAVGPQSLHSGIVKGSRNVVYGAGMFVKKDKFTAINEKGFVSFNSDRIGKSLASGGDSELCLAFQIAGYKIWYDQSLTFFHYIEPERLSFTYLNKLKKSIDSSRYITRFYLDYMHGYIPIINKTFWIKELIYTTKAIFWSLIKINNREFHRNFKFYIYLLTERSRYNSNVKKILNICRALDLNIKDQHKISYKLN